MKMSVASRLALASAAAVFIAACSTAEGPSAPMSAPDSPVYVGSPGVTVGGVVTACVDGSSPATTYSFATVTANAQGGDQTFTPSTGVTVPTPNCFDVLVRTGTEDGDWATATITASITGSPAGVWTWTCVSEDGTGLGCPIGTPVAGSNGTSTTGTGPVAQAGENSGHGTTVTFHFEPDAVTGAGCTYTQGRWKNKNSAITSQYDFDGGTNNGVTILQTPPKGNPYYILAHQYIAAALNVAAGASMDDGGAGTADDVLSAFNAATTYFGLASAAAPLPAGYTKAQITAWAATLDAYNNGLLGPGHCDETAPIGSGSH